MAQVQENKVREYRLKAELTQSQLAEAVGTSQQQIARIERAVHTAKLDLARRISKALDVPLEKLFPKSAAAIKRLDALDTRSLGDEMLNGGKLTEALDESGIELDPRCWILKVRLSNGVEKSFQISSKERKYARRAIQDQSNQFLDFETDSCRILINMECLAYAHFLFEPPALVSRQVDSEDAEDGSSPSRAVIAYTAGSSNALAFTVEADEGDPDDEDDEGQFRGLFHVASCLSRADDPYQFIFTDGDGEEVFLNSKSLVMLSVPIWVLNPDALEAEFEEESAA